MEKYDLPKATMAEINQVPLVPVDLVDSEAQLATKTPKSRMQHLWSAARYSIAHIIVPFLVVVLAFSVCQEYFQNHQPAQARNEIVLKTYGTDDRYMSLDRKYDYLWSADLSPPTINLTASTSPDPAAIGSSGGIAMFHDLHCLASLRKALQTAHYNHTDPGLDPSDNGHWPHCLYHLRQMILCKADDTVEVPRFLNGSLGNVSISGATDVRECKSSDVVFERIRREREAGNAL